MSVEAVTTINLDLVIGSGNNQNVIDNDSLTLVVSTGHGNVSNNGTLGLLSGGNNTNLVITGGIATFSGNGTLALSNNGANRIYGNAATDGLLNAAGHTIRGSGQLGIGPAFGLANAGFIIADQSTALTVRTGGTASTNTGTLLATSGGTLAIISSVIDNTGGLIEAQDNSAVTLTSTAVTNGTLTSINAGRIRAYSGSTFAALTMSTGSVVELPDNNALNLVGTLTNNGTLSLLSGGNNTDLVLAATGVTFTGGGNVTFSNNGANRITSASGATLVNVDNTIRGAGQIGVGRLQLDNRSLIEASYGGGTLTLQASAGGIRNTGTLRAANGATLAFASSTVDNTAGLIAAHDASVVTLASTAVTGGTISANTTGRIRTYTGSTLSGLTLSSGTIVELPDNNSLNLVGALTNGGTISLLSGGNNTDLIVPVSGLTLSGGGGITFSNNGANRIRGDSGATFVNVDNTIRGAGQIGVGTVQLDNRALIEASYAGSTLTVQPNASGATNTGTMRAANGGVLRLQSGTFNNAAGNITALAGSTVQVANSAVSAGTMAIGAGATLALESSVIDQGTLNSTSTGIIRTTSGGSTLAGTLNLVGGAELILNDNTSLTLLASGTYNNDGTVRLASGGNNTRLLLGGGDVTFNGSGSLTLGNNGANQVTATGATASRLILGANQTLQGGGAVGLGQLGILNQGQIIANSPTTLTLQPSAAGLTNAGTLRAASGATLRLTNGSYGNTGALIEAQAGSTVQFEAAAIAGGTLSNASTGRLVNAATSSYAGITLGASSTLAVNDNTAAVFSGTFTNNGNVAVNSGGNNTDFSIPASGLTLTGGGFVSLGNNGANRIVATSGTASFVNLDNTLHGAGQLSAGTLQVDNRSTISADINGATLYVRPSSSGFANSGHLQSLNGATLRLENGTFNNTGGDITAEANSAVQLSGTTIAGGTLRSTGTGVIRNVGSNTLGGTLTLAPGTQLEINDNTSLTFLASGSFTNGAAIKLLSGGNATSLIFSGGDVALVGGGTITLGNNGGNQLIGLSGGRLLNTDHTIQGSGQIGAGTMGIVNDCWILANQSTPLIMRPSAAGVTNNGLLEAAANAKLTLQSGVFMNTHGSIAASGSGAVVELSGVSINGGYLLSDAGAVLRLVASSTFADVNFETGSWLQVVDNTAATFTGSLVNAGRITLESGGNSTGFVLGTGDLTLTGGGSLLLSNNGGNVLRSATAGYRLTNVDNLIQGSGQIGAHMMGLTNQFTIKANQSTSLIIDSGAAGVINLGLLRAESGATLQLQNSVFTNAGGTIEAYGTSSRVDFAGATISGGTIQSSAGGILRQVASSAFANVTFAAGSTLQVFDNTAATFSGTIDNRGVIQLLSGGNATDLAIAASGALLQGNGAIELSNNGSNRITGVATLNNVDNTIRGSGQLGANQLTLINTGRIEATQSTPLTVDLANATPFTNQGVMRATTGGTLIVADPMTNAAGVVVEASSTFTAQGAFSQSAGSLIVMNGTVNLASGSFQSGGAILGYGTINGPVTNSGIIAAGGPPTWSGTLTFTSPLSLMTTSQILVELKGPATFGQISAPTIAVGGYLGVSFGSGYQSTIAPDATFTFLSTANATGLSGTFIGLANGTRFATSDGSGSFLINYLPNGVMLTEFQPIPEPSTWALLGTGAALVVWLGRRRRSRRQAGACPLNEIGGANRRR